MPQTFVQWSQPYMYDNGSQSSVGINGNGAILEVHNGPQGDDNMYYRLGQYATTPSSDLSECIAWQQIYQNGSGSGNPLSADINNQYAVQVYDVGKNLNFQWAALEESENGSLNWSVGDNYTSGEQPAIAINQNNNVVAVHQSSKFTSYTLWYATGAPGSEGGMGSAAQILQPDGSSVSGEFIQVAINDAGTVVVAYSSTSLGPGNTFALNLIVGTLQSNGSVSFGYQSSPLIANGNFDIALDNLGNLLIFSSFLDFRNRGYLGWISGTVSGNSVTLSEAPPVPLLYGAYSSITVTMAINANGNLIAEAGAGQFQFQYFVGQAAFSQDYSHWMQDNLNVIGDIPLNLLALPGTHDSGTFALSASSDLSPDNPSPILSGLSGLVGIGWAQSQDLDFLGQLNAGIRYFDLRICYSLSSTYVLWQNQDDQIVAAQPPVGYYLCHGYYSLLLGELFTAIQNFYAQGDDYTKEIILLDMNHIFTNTVPGASWNNMSYWMTGGPNGEFPGLCQYINANIGSILLPPSLNGMSLNQIVASAEYAAGGRVILFFDDAYSAKQNSAYWPNVDCASATYWQNVDQQAGSPPAGMQQTINSPWPDVTSLQGLVIAPTESSTANTPPPLTLQNVLAPAWSTWLAQRTPPIQFTVLQCVGTPGQPQIENGNISPFPSGPPTLQSWEAGICSPSLFWLSGQTDAIAVNIVLVDWLEQTIVTPLCMALNLSKAKAASGGG